MIETVVGIDPGKRIGFARFDVEDKKILHQSDRTVNWSLFTLIFEGLEILAAQRKLAKEPPITVVVEDFLLFSHKAQGQIGSRMEAVQVIGAVKYAVDKSKGGMKLIMQPASINPTAAKWSGRGIDVVNVKGHLPDNVSASNHAHYYLVSNGLLRHRILD